MDAWTPCDVPPKPAPWLCGLSVENLDNRYDNAPSFTLHTTVRTPFPDDEAVYDYVDGGYVAISPDGLCAKRYSHGPLYQIDGRWQTRESEGFGGAHFHIKLKDGRDAILRGPWFGRAPKGFVHASYKPLDYPIAFFGLFFHPGVIVEAVRRFRPDLELAWVIRDEHEAIEPLIDGVPKGFPPL